MWKAKCAHWSRFWLWQPPSTCLIKLNVSVILLAKILSLCCTYLILPFSNEFHLAINLECRAHWQMIRELNNTHWDKEIQHTLTLERMLTTSKTMEKIASKITEKVDEVCAIYWKKYSQNVKNFLRKSRKDGLASFWTSRFPVNWIDICSQETG